MTESLPKRITPNPVKICFVQPVQSPYWSERLRVLARRDDLEVTLLLERGSFAHRPRWKTLSIGGVRVEVLGSTIIETVCEASDLGYRIDGIRSIPWRLSLALRKLNPDLVLLCNATQVLMALPARMLLGIPVALIVEDTTHAHRGLSWFHRTIRSWAYRRADHWFSLSSDALSYLAEIGVTKDIMHTSWSLDMASFGRGELGKTESNGERKVRKRTVLFVGRLITSKGILLLLEAWAALPKEARSNTRLVLLGDGPLREEAKKYCIRHKLNDVDFHGNVPYEEVMRMLGTADLFVLPTLQDIYSLAVLEAMASGCPVVITPFAGSRELVEHGVNGWVVDPTMKDELAKTLTHALSENVDLKAMGQAARARVKHMDNKIVMSQFAEDLRQLVGRH